MPAAKLRPVSPNTTTPRALRTFASAPLWVSVMDMVTDMLKKEIKDMVTDMQKKEIMDMVMELEDSFDVSIPMNVVAEIHTVDQLADTILDLRAKR